MTVIRACPLSDSFNRDPAGRASELTLVAASRPPVWVVLKRRLHVVGLPSLLR